MKVENIVVGLLFVLIMGLSIACGVQRWNECRRVHPWWYCAGEHS